MENRPTRGLVVAKGARPVTDAVSPLRILVPCHPFHFTADGTPDLRLHRCQFSDSNMNYLFVFLLCHLNLTVVEIAALQVVNFVLGGNPAYEVRLSGPTYDVAFQDLVADGNRSGINKRSLIVKGGYSKTCDDEVELVHSMLGEIFRHLSSVQRPYVVQFPGTTKEHWDNRGFFSEITVFKGIRCSY